MKTATLIVRIIMGGIYLLASLVVLLNLAPEPKVSGEMKIALDGFAATVYLMATVKFVEFIVGVAFILGKFVPLATIIIFPISLNIFLFHIFLEPSGLPIALFLILGNLLLAYHYRNKYQALFAPNN